MDPNIIAQLGKMGGQAKPSAAPEAPPTQLDPGQSGDIAQFLVPVLQNLQKAIQQATDKEQLAVLRSISMLVSSLISKDHEGQMSQLSESQPQTPSPMGMGGQGGMGSMMSMMGGQGGPMGMR